MGGFEGGDEGGFWDEDAVANLIKEQHRKKKSQKRVSIETENSIYRIEDDPLLSIIPQTCRVFTIEGCADIPLEANAIYRAYKALIDYTCDSDIEEFFYNHKIVITDYNPDKNTQNFLLLVKELCNLALSNEELQQIQESVV
ncbi:MAG: hypothetical protein Q9M34_10905 [Sulfurimonas sp.]|nr:hypothetical protein [Sulfurimonas sp.]